MFSVFGIDYKVANKQSCKIISNSGLNNINLHPQLPWDCIYIAIFVY